MILDIYRALLKGMLSLWRDDGAYIALRPAKGLYTVHLLTRWGCNVLGPCCNLAVFALFRPFTCTLTSRPGHRRFLLPLVVMLALACVQETNENVFVVLDLAPPSAKRIRDLDVSGLFVAVVSTCWEPLCDVSVFRMPT